MPFTYGQNLKFKSNIPLCTWVSSLMPKGQMGMIEDHIAVQIDIAKFQIPMSVAEKLFVDASYEEEDKEVEELVVESDEIVKTLDEEIEALPEKIEKATKKQPKSKAKKPDG